jgi:hypothetical protein
MSLPELTEPTTPVQQKPCPFCGETTRISMGYYGQPAQAFYAVCMMCGAHGPMKYASPGGQAALDWNEMWTNRAPVAQPELDALRAEIELLTATQAACDNGSCEYDGCQKQDLTGYRETAARWVTEYLASKQDAARYRLLRCFRVAGFWPRDYRSAGTVAFTSSSTDARQYTLTVLDELLDEMLGVRMPANVGQLRSDYAEWRKRTTSEVIAAVNSGVPSYTDQ